MTLLVDAGNTRIKWCRLSDETITDTGWKGHSHDNVGAVATASWSGMTRPHQLLISNVAGAQAERDLSSTSLELWGITPDFVRSESTFADLINGYCEPDRLGVDRWMAMIGARTMARGAIAVVDCGTATTMDYVDSTGRHHGGVIIPGVELMRRSLAVSTGDLPMVSSEASTILATDTNLGIASGTVHAAVSSVLMFREHLLSRDNGPVSWFITGGGSGLLAPSLPDDFRVEPHLVLHGLAAIARAGTK